MDALRENLVAAHRNPRPDLVSVVVSARGFSDLLELAEFAKRIARQNAQVVDAARAMRAEVTRQANALVRLQTRNRRLAAALERKRDSAQAVETALLRERAHRLAGKASREAELREVRGQLATLRHRQTRAARAERGPAASPNGSIPTDPGGQAQAPPGAPAAVARVVAAGNAIAGLPYVYGGGHGSFRANAYDCSGSISYALAAAGLLSAPLASGGFMSWGESGPGRYITVYANAGHAFMVVGGWRFDTSALRSGGTRWTRGMRPTGGFVARHPPGL
jgi:cell wall-associated NlpC family hydrolase